MTSSFSVVCSGRWRTPTKEEYDESDASIPQRFCCPPLVRLHLTQRVEADQMGLSVAGRLCCAGRTIKRRAARRVSRR
jgi:hypothetical protein